MKDTPITIHIIRRMGWVLLVGVGVYTPIEILMSQPASLLSFLIHHFLHVSLIVVMVFITCCIMLHKDVINPLKLICGHLYSIRHGRLEKMNLRVETKEMKGIVEGINELTDRIAMGGDLKSVNQAIRHTKRLRQQLEDLPSREDENSLAALRTLTILEDDLLLLFGERDWEESH